MLRHTTVMLVLSVTSISCLASEGDDQARSFANIYASLCMKNLGNLESLREKLKPMPRLSPEKAALFLAGHSGDAWPVPDKHGHFVLALPAGRNLCMVHARRADTGAARRLFTRLTGSPPSPFVGRLVRDEQADSASNGRTHTVAYEWSVPNGPRRMLFTLTTASAQDAQLQVLGSAAVVDR